MGAQLLQHSLASLIKVSYTFLVSLIHILSIFCCIIHYLKIKLTNVVEQLRIYTVEPDRLTIMA